MGGNQRWFYGLSDANQQYLSKTLFDYMEEYPAEVADELIKVFGEEILYVLGIEEDWPE